VQVQLWYKFPPFLFHQAFPVFFQYRIVSKLITTLSLFQLIGVVFACCLAKSIRKEYESV